MESVLVAVAGNVSKTAVTSYLLLYYVQRLRNYLPHYLKPYKNINAIFDAYKISVRKKIFPVF